MGKRGLTTADTRGNIGKARSKIYGGKKESIQKQTRKNRKGLAMA